MATVTFVYTTDYVAEMLEEDVDLLQAIIYNDDNLTYGNIITVVTGDDQTTSALTDDGIDELRQILADARQSAEKWQEFLECFVDDQEVVERVKTFSPTVTIGRLPQSGRPAAPKDPLCPSDVQRRHAWRQALPLMGWSASSSHPT